MLTYIAATQWEREKKNENERKTIQQPNKKRKDKHERTKLLQLDSNPQPLSS